MSNVNAPYGFKPVRHLTGGQIGTNTYPIAVGFTTAIFRGDLLENVSDGTIELAEADDVTNIGIFWGCEYDDPTGAHKWSKYWPGTASCTNIVAYVYDDPYIVFQAQTDATGATATEVHLQVDMATYAAGSTKTGISGCYLDMAAGTGTTGGAFRILRLVNDGDNVAGAYADVEVIFADTFLKA